MFSFTVSQVFVGFKFFTGIDKAIG